MDEALIELFADAADGGRALALVALGGYGRGELCPGSDVDLMVLHAERRPERVREVAERVFYPFWDAGIALGHAVRTVKEALAEAEAGLDTATALLEGRLIAGDPSLLDELETGMARRVARDRAGFLARIAAADRVRHEANGSAAQLMEPDVKESSGGLRDVHSVGWAARALGLPGTEALVSEGLLRVSERAALDQAEEFLIRVRSALHLEAGSRSNKLTLDRQPRLAEVFGYTDTAGLDAPDALMRALFDHARHVEHVRAVAFERIEARAAGKPPPRGVADPGDPEAALEVFARWAEGGPVPTPSDLDRLEAVVASFPPRAAPVEASGSEPEGANATDAGVSGDAVRWTPAMRRALVRILAAGEPGARALETMDRVGIMSRLLPEWSDVRCRPQRDPYHTFTVDLHLIRAVAETVRLLAGAGAGAGDGSGDDAVARQAAAAVRDPETLLLGAFLHDSGKVGRGEHVPIGVEVAGHILERLGVDGRTRDDVLFLVGEHLLLVDTATRRDLSDPALIAEVASRVGDPERLAMLYLLTVADAAATGPHARSPWRAALVRELVAKIEHVLEQPDGLDENALISRRSVLIREALASEPADVAARFLGRMPRRYLAVVDPARASEHLRLVDPPPGAGEVRTAIGPGQAPGAYRLAVSARDRPGLLSKIAGALALSGLSVLSAEVFTTEDGVALDLFEVQPVFHGEVDEERWRRFRTDLRRAIEGRISLEVRVAEKRRHYPPVRSDVPTEVTVDNDASSASTVIDVAAADRVGLLFQITRALHELELDVHLAKVATYAGRVVDAFYVRDLFGKKVDDPEHAREIAAAIEARVAQD